MRVHELDTPAVVIDVDVLRRNLEDMASYSAGHGLALRPHTKTHKIPEIARMQLQSGACGLTVAKLGEAELMARAGFEDIMIAYPIMGAAKLERLAELAQKVRLRISADSAEAAEGIDWAAGRAGVKIGMLAEMDIGARRCGVQTPEALVRLSQRMAALPNLEFLGFMFYLGHIRASAAEQIPMLVQADSHLKEAQDSLFRSGIEVKVVSGGSTPTAPQSHHMKTLTEIRPGSYVFNDMNTVAIGATDLSRCAVSIHTMVVSNAVAGRAVIDAGSKTLSSDAIASGKGFGYIREHPGAVLESMTEEHGHVDTSALPDPMKIGERLRIIPNHVCTAMNMHDEVWGAQGDEVVAHWRVEARGLIR